jgi:hypothetical protein
MNSPRVFYVHCALCGRVVRKWRWQYVPYRSHFCGRSCSDRAERLLSEYLADGRFAVVLAPELEQIKAAHRAKVAASQAGYERTARRIDG